MSDDIQDPSDRFSRSTSAAIRAIGRRRDAAAAFGRKGPGPRSVAHLRLLSPDPTWQEIAEARGEADSFALRLRHHNERLHRRFRPADGKAGALFDAIERIRFEALGARAMPGVAANLAAATEARNRNRSDLDPDSGSPRPSPAMIEELLRQRLMADDAVSPSSGRGEFEGLAASLAASLGDQKAFALVARRLLGILGFDPGPAEGTADEDLADDEDAVSSRKPKKEETAATATGHQQLIKTSPQESPAGPEDTDAASSGAAKPDLLPEGGGEDPGGLLKRPHPTSVPERRRFDSYAIYTTEYDQIARAETLCDPAEMIALRRVLDRRLNEVQASVGRYAGRFARAVLARAERAWEADLDEGLLDTRRLARVAATPDRPLAFKRPTATPFRDTTMTLLIDNSGSMRGDPIEIAAVSADILGGTLERCGVTFEVLGFTTAAWKGGQCATRWQAAGRPSHPGRLNELHHIISKAASEPWRRARRNLGLMLRDNLLKENVDGEALLWAHGRLLARPETRRILIVLSDGEPVDMATLDVNGDDYLERHLVGVIDDIVHCSPVELHAIGIGHDVNRYYPSAISVASANDLTIELLAKVAKLFEAEGGCPRGGTGVRPGRPAPLPRPARLMDKGLVTLDDFARLPAIAGDGARFAPTPGELGDGALFRHCR